MKSGTTYPTNQALALLVAGDAGAGKSTFGLYWPRPYIVDVEHNLKGAVDHHTKRLGKVPEFSYDYLDVDETGAAVADRAQWDRLMKLTDAAMVNPEVGVVVFDGFGKICDLLKEKLVWETNAAEKPLIIGGQRCMTQSLWNPFATLLKNWVWGMRKHSKPFIVTAHLKVEQNELVGTKEQQIDLQGQLQGSFPKLFSDFWKLDVVPVAKSTQYPKGVKYFIRTVADNRIKLKTSFSSLPDEFEVGDKCFQDLIEGMK